MKRKFVSFCFLGILFFLSHTINAYSIEEIETSPIIVTPRFAPPQLKSTQNSASSRQNIVSHSNHHSASDVNWDETTYSDSTFSQRESLSNPVRDAMIEQEMQRLSEEIQKKKATQTKAEESGQTSTSDLPQETEDETSSDQSSGQTRYPLGDWRSRPTSEKNEPLKNSAIEGSSDQVETVTIDQETSFSDDNPDQNPNQDVSPQETGLSDQSMPPADEAMPKPAQKKSEEINATNPAVLDVKSTAVKNTDHPSPKTKIEWRVEKAALPQQMNLPKFKAPGYSEEMMSEEDWAVSSFENENQSISLKELRKSPEHYSGQSFMGNSSDIDIITRANQSLFGDHSTSDLNTSENYYYLIGTSPIEITLQINGGYRLDNLDWSIANTGGTPNVLSELTWRDLEMYEIKAKWDVVFNNAYVVDGYASYGDIYSGENQDSDYSGNDRTSEFSRSNNKSDDDEVYDFSSGFGYRMSLDQYHEFWLVNDLWLTLLGGYSYHRQNLRETEGFQTIPPDGPFPGLNSTYKAEWQGPWLGFELFGTRNRLNGFFRFEYHWAEYFAEADWNLRSDFQHPRSYEHEADGTGMIFGFGGGYALNDHWSIDLNADFKDFETNNGTDRTFFTDGTIVETMLNEVSWDSWAVTLGATCRFGSGR